MIIIRLILTIICPLLLGYCIAALIYKNRQNVPFIERFSLSWGIGIGLLGLVMFTFSLFGIPLTLQTVSIPTAILIILIVTCLLIKKIVIFDLSAFKRLVKSLIELKAEENKWLVFAEKALILLISIKIIYVFFDALVKPLVNFDDLWRQGCIAKIIFVTGKVLTQQSLELAGPHPYLNPLSQAWVYMGIGTWNDALGKIIFALCFASLLFLFYVNLRKQFSRIASLLFTYLLTSFPLIIYHAGTAYSDFMQTFYYSVGIIYLYQWIKNKENAHLYFSALFLGFGNFVKQTGIPFWIAAAAVLFIYLLIENRKELKSGIKFTLLSAAVSSPWLFFQNSFLARRISGLGAKLAAIFGRSAVTGAEAPLTEALKYGIPTLPNILYHLGRRMFAYADWQILWFVFILVLLFSWKRIRGSNLKYLLLIIIFNLGMIVYAFSDPVTYQFLVDGTLVNRIMMYQIPVVLFFVANCILLNYQPAEFKKEESQTQKTAKARKAKPK